MSDKGNNAGEMMSVREVADLLGVSVGTVYGIIKAGTMPCYRFGTGRGCVRVRRVDLENYLASCREESREEQVSPTPRRLKHINLKHV